MTPMTKRTLLLAALVTSGVAGSVGVLTWVSNRGTDPVYDDDTALAGWADRLAHPPSSVEAPAEIGLPETSTGRPFRAGVPLPVDRSLNVKGPKPRWDAADEDRFPSVASTSELLLTVSKRTVRFEGRDVLPVPADATRGFDARYKHSEADIELLQGAVASLVYARERASTLRKAFDPTAWREDLLVMADRDLPCRLLVEVLATAAALQFTPHLVGRRAGRPVDMDLSRTYERDWLVRLAVLPHALELKIPHERGVVVECDRGRVVEEGDGARFITIARRDDGHDFEALSDCARRVEEAFSHELVYLLYPAPAVSVQILVSTIDALREDAARDVVLALSPWPVNRGHAP
jgi:hypothetical protein